MGPKIFEKIKGEFGLLNQHQVGGLDLASAEGDMSLVLEEPVLELRESW